MRKPVERSRWRTALVISAVAITLSSYLFVTAPPPLAAPTPPTDTIPTRALFSILELENDAARGLYSEDIVNRGKEAGLKFDEHWREDAVKAGPLPALFLRETAKHLEGSGSQLGLFLGSRFPINQANRLTGNQAERFVILESTNKPQFFYEASTQRHTAMFTDRAIAEVCVKCHNEHKDSPKTDWKLGAIMGATTWMYPEDKVTRTRALELIGTLRASIRATYASYLAEVVPFGTIPADVTPWGAFLMEATRRIVREAPLLVQGAVLVGVVLLLADGVTPPLFRLLERHRRWAWWLLLPAVILYFGYRVACLQADLCLS